MFYAGNTRIVGRKPIWVQGALETCVCMFERVGLYTDLGKIKSMTFTPGFIWRQLVNYAYNQQATWGAPPYGSGSGHG